MADKYWALRQQIGNYIERMRTRGMSPKHIESAEYILYKRFAKPLKDAGLELNVKKIGEREIMFLMNYEFGGILKTRFWYLSIVSTFLKKNGNGIVDSMDLQRPQDERINVDWLTDNEEREVWDFIKNHATPLERAILTVELGAGLRRIEVMRLKIGAVRNGTMEVLGKGRGGGKKRTIVISNAVRESLDIWMMERERLVIQKLRRCPRAMISDNVFVHDKNGIHDYSENGMDRILDAIKVKMMDVYGHKFTFSHHTMRRTFGRRAYFNGARIEEIQNIYGHETPAQTYKYLGLRADDQRTVFDRMDSYIESLSETLPKMVKSEVIQ